MRKVIVFDSISLDGYFTDARGDMSWAHANQDAEWAKFGADNAGGEAAFVFGRVTYEMMVKHWPTAEARKQMPEIARAMNEAPKLVFSRTLAEATWQNSGLVKGDLVPEIRERKEGKGPPMIVMGSGTLVAQLTRARLVDVYQLVTCPIILGSGRTLFEGVEDRQALKLERSRTFKNGNVVSWYRPATA